MDGGFHEYALQAAVDTGFTGVHAELRDIKEHLAEVRIEHSAVHSEVHQLFMHFCNTQVSALQGTFLHDPHVPSDPGFLSSAKACLVAGSTNIKLDKNSDHDDDTHPLETPLAAAQTERIGDASKPISKAESSLPPGRSSERNFVLLGHWASDVDTFSEIQRAAELASSKMDKTVCRGSSWLRASITGLSMEAQRVFNPTSGQRLFWEMLGLIFLKYDFVMIPLSVFNLPWRHICFVLMELTMNIYWSFDILLSFRTAVYSDGKLETTPRKIAMSYIRSWFVLDLFVLVPAWISLIGGTAELRDARLLRGLKGIRFVRMLRMLRTLKLLRILKLKNRIDNLERYITSSFFFLCIAVLRDLAIILWLIHAIACLWYEIGTSSSNGWVYEDHIDKEPFSHIYVTCFQWSVQQFHPARPRSRYKDEGLVTENAFEVTTSLVGLLVSSVFVASITNVMLELQGLQQERKRQLRSLHSYVQAHNISADLAHRVKLYLVMQLEDLIDRRSELEFMHVLPIHLLKHMHDESRSPLIANHTLFRTLRRDHQKAMRDICHLAVEELVFQRNDSIFSSGDSCEHMFFVDVGQLQYRSQDELPH